MPRKPKSGGGWQAVAYTFRKAQSVGPINLWKSMSAKNACKTCALGMGGQLGGMRNEAGHFPEFCKKSLQAMVGDMQGAIQPEFFQKYSISDLQQLSSRELEHCGRLTFPVLLNPGANHYEPISWEDALSLVSQNLKAANPERTFFYSSGRSSNEAGFVLTLFARAFGTNHVNNCSYYCHQASGVGLQESLGTGTSTVSLADLDECDCIFLIGGNPASNHPRLITKLVEVQERGGKVIVVNPIEETGLVNFKIPSRPFSFLFGSKVATHYLQPKIGGDIALLVGICKYIVEQGQQDHEFISSVTESSGLLIDMVQNVEWSSIESASGLMRNEITHIARVYVESERCIFAWTMGITHHLHGVDNVSWIVNLALLRGMVGKRGAGLMPIRGHSNVQGMGTINVTPALKKVFQERLTELGIHVPSFRGYDTMAAMDAALAEKCDCALCLGGNIYGSNPNSARAKESLSKISTLVYLSTSLNTGHVHGTGKTTVILPVLARDEDPEKTTQESMFSFVRLSDGGIKRHTGPRSETDVLTSIASETIGDDGPINWSQLKSHEAVRRLIAKVVPEYEKITEFETSNDEFEIPGRNLSQPRFNTPSGLARFICPPIPEAPIIEAGQFFLMTIRSEGQFNTVVYEEEDIYRGQERRDIVLMNPGDIEERNLIANQKVKVVSECGEMNDILVRPFNIAKGCIAMYYPEANILVPSKVDPKSKTPAFKSVVARVLES